MNRRAFLGQCIALRCAPAIARASSLMPSKGVLVTASGLLYTHTPVYAWPEVDYIVRIPILRGASAQWNGEHLHSFPAFETISIRRSDMPRYEQLKNEYDASRYQRPEAFNKLYQSLRALSAETDLRSE